MPSIINAPRTKLPATPISSLTPVRLKVAPPDGASSSAFNRNITAAPSSAIPMPI